MICAIASIRKIVACHANYCNRLVEHNMARADGRKDFKECVYRAKNCKVLSWGAARMDKAYACWYGCQLEGSCHGTTTSSLSSLPVKTRSPSSGHKSSYYLCLHSLDRDICNRDYMRDIQVYAFQVLTKDALEIKGSGI